MTTPDQNQAIQTKADASTDEEDSFSLRNLSKTHIVLMISSTIMFFLCGVCYSLLAPFYPIVAQEKGTSQTLIGLVFSVYEIVMFVASPLFGVYMSQIGAEFATKSGAFIGGCCAILFGILNKCPPGIPFIATYFAVRIVEAIAFSAVIISSYTVLSSLFPKYSSLIIGLQQTTYCFGMAVGPAIGGVLYDLGGFGLPFYVSGGITVLNGLTLLVILPESPPAPEPAEISKFKLLKEPMVWISFINAFFAAIAISALEPTLSLHLKTLDMGPTMIGVIFMISPIVLILTTPFLGYLVDEKGHYVIGMLVGGICNMLSMALIGPTPLLPFLHLSIATVVIATLVLGPGMALVAQTRCLLVSAEDAGYELNRDTYSMVGSLVCSVFFLGAVFGAFLGGLLTDIMGFPNATTVFCGCYIVLLLITIVYFIGRLKLWRDLESRHQGETSRLVKGSSFSMEIKNAPPLSHNDCPTQKKIEESSQ